MTTRVFFSFAASGRHFCSFSVSLSVSFYASEQVTFLSERESCSNSPMLKVSLLQFSPPSFPGFPKPRKRACFREKKPLEEGHYFLPEHIFLVLNCRWRTGATRAAARRSIQETKAVFSVCVKSSAKKMCMCTHTHICANTAHPIGLSGHSPKALSRSFWPTLFSRTFLSPKGLHVAFLDTLDSSGNGEILNRAHLSTRAYAKGEQLSCFRIRAKMLLRQKYSRGVEETKRREVRTRPSTRRYQLFTLFLSLVIIVSSSAG